MYEVSHRQSIIKFCRLDLSGDAKQTSHVINTSAPLFLSFSPVSELLFELLYCKRTEMLYELFGAGGRPSTWSPPGKLVEHFSYLLSRLPSSLPPLGYVLLHSSTSPRLLLSLSCLFPSLPLPLLSPSLLLLPLLVVSSPCSPCSSLLPLLGSPCAS